MQKEVTDIKNQNKNTTIFHRIASYASNEKDQTFLVGLFEDMQNLNEKNNSSL